ncbi:hypothetical protein FACS18949_13500 [Clostridia bacterium]|nr:hypothetical protein FACS189425_06330 [Clostridia bacterium]GHV35465.1 hypothetical protein FACS18949_13500 [Clostridia bacterium]
MNNSVYNVDYTHSLPPPLRKDTKMLAFAQVMANRFRENAELAKLANIYARIDELPEKLLDILAYDLHVDWYDYSYPVEAKRQVIKDSIKVHKRLGTVYALKTALGSLYPQSDIEEWFDYGGQPGHFRVTLDVTNALVTASYSRIIRTVAYFKRLTAHLDTMIYQTHVNIGIRISTEVFEISAARTGMYNSGTHPRLNYVAVVGGAAIAISPSGTAVPVDYTPSGTKPQINMPFMQGEINLADGIEISAAKISYDASSPDRPLGTKPTLNIVSDINEFSIAATIDSVGFPFSVEKTGTTPKQNMLFAGNAMSEDGLSPKVETYAYSTTYAPAGTKNCGE